LINVLHSGGKESYTFIGTACLTSSWSSLLILLIFIWYRLSLRETKQILFEFVDVKELPQLLDLGSGLPGYICFLWGPWLLTVRMDLTIVFFWVYRDNGTLLFVGLIFSFNWVLLSSLQETSDRRLMV
jgi:hypothetical protein